MAEEDWDRRFVELLQELRVMQTGIQIVFAWARAISGFLAAVYIGLWYVLPIVTRLARD